MRWRIPIVAALAAFVAVSCDQAPTAVQEATPDAPTFQMLDNEWDTWAFTFNNCVEDLAAEGKYKYMQSYTETPSGNWAYQEKFNIHGTAVGLTTGYKYVWNDVWLIWQENGGPDRAYNDHYTDNWHVIGKGQAPDFHVKVTWLITYNANGDLVIEFENAKESTLCD